MVTPHFVFSKFTGIVDMKVISEIDLFKKIETFDIINKY